MPFVKEMYGEYFDLDIREDLYKNLDYFNFDNVSFDKNLDFCFVIDFGNKTYSCIFSLKGEIFCLDLYFWELKQYLIGSIDKKQLEKEVEITSYSETHSMFDQIDKNKLENSDKLICDFLDVVLNDDKHKLKILLFED